MKKLIFTIVCFTVGVMCFAQTNTVPQMDINGLIIGEHYTDAQMRAALGEPTRYRSQVSELGESRTYQYGPIDNYDLFRHSEMSGFNIFGVSTPKFTLFNGKLKVGDNISKVTQLGVVGRLEKKSPTEYYFYPQYWDDPLVISVDANNVITSFWLSASI